ncbi:MAG: MBL fold metallo-hydrolase [Deltaproteobacteria bacterium]|nr:MBL fold metallo-hydrolase [Deltaproteobacteria bacterium]
MKSAVLRIFALMCLIGTLLAPGVLHAQAKRAITQITGDLYRFQNNFHYSVFLVTPDGVIVTDPINAEAARWLKAEIAKRFDRPIKYLILSHDHRDHSAGGEVFADTATVIAHEKAKAVIIAERRPTAVPDITFSDRMTVELGGKRVELIYTGRNHSDNSIVMLFPDERTLFAVDFVSVKRLPFRNLSDSYYPDWIDSLRRVEELDFDILAPGHGAMGMKRDVRDHRRYHEDLYNAVVAAARAGQSLEQMKASITLDQYKDWGSYADWRKLNIEGVYARVVLQRRGN